MSEVKNEISRLDIGIPGLINCRLEVHENQKKSSVATPSVIVRIDLSRIDMSRLQIPPEKLKNTVERTKSLAVPTETPRKSKKRRRISNHDEQDRWRHHLNSSKNFDELSVSSSSSSSSSSSFSSSGTSDHQQKPEAITKVYVSYFEMTSDEIEQTESRDQSDFLCEAERLKHAADKEKDDLAKTMLYLEAVLYFLLAGAAILAEPGKDIVAFTMYRDALQLIKNISSKFRSQQQYATMQENINSKLAILWLRCQSHINLKLHKICRHEINDSQRIISNDKPNMTEMMKGNMPSPLSPTSVGSHQSSGYSSGQQNNINPPCYMMPIQTHQAYQRQAAFFNYLMSCHDLWEQADMLVVRGNHTNFFIELDHENGPVTLHSSLNNLVKYVQAGIQKLRQNVNM